MKAFPRHVRTSLLLPAGLLVFDRILKMLASDRYMTEALQLIPGFLKFEFFANEGIAFSIPFSGPLLWALSVALIIIFTIFAFRHDPKDRPVLLTAYALFILGAASNLYDRVILGHTVDYLIFFGRSAVNIADGMIIVGAALLLWNKKNGPSGPFPGITSARNAIEHSRRPE